jgi:hypothetical protein
MVVCGINGREVYPDLIFAFQIGNAYGFEELNRHRFQQPCHIVEANVFIPLDTTLKNGDILIKVLNQRFNQGDLLLYFGVWLNRGLSGHPWHIVYLACYSCNAMGISTAVPIIHMWTGDHPGDKVSLG